MKFFKNENDLEQDPIKYLNRKKDHRLFIFSSSWPKRTLSPKTKKIFQYSAIVGLPVIAIALGVTIGIITNNAKNPSLVNEVVVETNISKRRVYLISNDNYAVPLTVSLDKRENVYEEMLDVINLLKVSSKAATNYLRGFIPADTRVNSFANIDGKLIVDFSEEFLNYDEKDEEKMAECLIATLSQFDNVQTVQISVDGDVLTKLKNNVSIPKKITFMNARMLPSLADIKNKQLVTIFYQKEISEELKYLIPVSLYSEKGETFNITYANSLNIELPSKYQLNKLEVYEQINKNQTKNEKFILDVNTSALVDEGTVNKELYEMVMLSLDLMGMETKVEFDIEGNAVAVEEIYSSEEQEVDSIYYNEIKI